MAEVKFKLNVGQEIWWVHCSNRVYKGTIEGFMMCDYQGAIYAHIHSPSFKLNNYPVVHYSHCFSTKKDAVQFANELKKDDRIVKRCDRCEYEHAKYMRT